jgi:hypothetical protein
MAPAVKAFTAERDPHPYPLSKGGGRPMRIDFFVSPGCPGCPAARAVLEAFARGHPGVEVHEWDLSRDPGPALGRGIFATPSVLLDGTRILAGVPRVPDLRRHLETTAHPSGSSPAGAAPPRRR